MRFTKIKLTKMIHKQETHKIDTQTSLQKYQKKCFTKNKSNKKSRKMRHKNDP